MLLSENVVLLVVDVELLVSVSVDVCVWLDVVLVEVVEIEVVAV